MVGMGPPAPEQKSTMEMLVLTGSFWTASERMEAACWAGERVWRRGSLVVHSEVRMAWHLDDIKRGVLLRSQISKKRLE